ncbi:MAG: hypothetical protein J0M03_05460 [Acidobacteria bacterium]|nr:hypothetical protein [Acidobacteriota bacterium]
MPQYALEKDIITKKCDVCGKSYLITRHTKTCVHCGYNKKNKSQHQHVALDLNASSFADGMQKFLSSNKYFGSTEKKIVILSVILGFVGSLFFQSGLPISSKIVFIPLAIVLSLFIGLAITGAAALSNIFQKLAKPLSSEATQKRYKEWKENKVTKKINKES